MHCLLISILVLRMYSLESAAQSSSYTSEQYPYYLRMSIQDDLKLLNMSCETYDSCAKQRYADSLLSHACHCGSYCVQFDTCCLDSPYISVRKPKVRPVCRSAYSGPTLFMMDRCPSSDNAWEGLCRNEWNGEDDILSIVPVTSLQTSITYKNYFCFKCHETNEDFVRWTVSLTSDAVNSNYSVLDKRVSLTYDSFHSTWIAVIDEYVAGSFPVNISIVAPYDITLLTKRCEVGVISSCSEHWTDKGVRDKCEAYTAIKKRSRDGWTFSYRNMHCAACNFEIIDNNYICNGFVASFTPQSPVSGGAYGGYGFSYGTKLYSFSHILDINRYDRDKVGKIQKCDDDSLWDPYADKCRKLTCALPGYSMRNGKCVIQ